MGYGDICGTIAVDDPSGDTEPINLLFDTEPVDEFESDREGGAMSGYKEEVVLDSEDERVAKCHTRQRKVTGGLSAASISEGQDGPLELDSGGNLGPGSGGDKIPPNSFVSTQAFAGVYHTESQEPEESSQANALKFVESFLSFNNVGLSPEFDSGKVVEEKSASSLTVKGIQDVAKRISSIRSSGDMESFKWIDNTEEDEQVSFQNRALNKRSVKMNSDVMQFQCSQGDAFLNKTAEKTEPADLTEHIVASAFPNSAPLQYFSGDACWMTNGHGHKVESDNIEDLENNPDKEKSVKQLQSVAVGEEANVLDVGFCTQMAAEAMEALSHAPSCVTTECYADPENSHYRSPKEVATNVLGSECFPWKKSIYPDARQRQLPAKRLVTSTSLLEQPKKRKLNSVSSLVKKMKSADSLIEKCTKGNLPVASHVSGRRSTRNIKKRDVGAEKSNNTIELNHLVRQFSVLNRTSPLKRLQQEDVIKSSPIALGIRRVISGARKEDKVKDPKNYSARWEESIFMDSSVLKRPKQTLSDNDMFDSEIRFKGNCHNSDAFENVRTRGVNWKKQISDEVGLLSLSSRLDSSWSCPRRKRTKRSLQRIRGGVGPADSLYASTVSGSGRELQISKSNVCSSSIEVCRNFASHRFAHSSLECEIEGDLIRQANHDSSFMDKGGALKDLSKAKRSRQSSERDDDNNVHACAEKRMPQGKVSRENVVSHCISGSIPANAISQLSIAVKDFPKNEYSRKPSRSNTSKSFMLKELLSLGITESLPNFTWKDLRKRRRMAHIRVLFSLHLGDRIIRKQKEVLARLRISVASSSADATHFVADKFVRTRNMLEFIALGKPVVTSLWLESCWQAGCLVDEKKFILTDAKKEKELGFNMATSLARASQNPLLEGRKVLITQRIKPDKEMITSLIKAVNGQVIHRSQILKMSSGNLPMDILILSCEEDLTVCAPLAKKGAKIYSSELILSGIVTQKLEYERHELFRDMLW